MVEAAALTPVEQKVLDAVDRDSSSTCSPAWSPFPASAARRAPPKSWSPPSSSSSASRSIAGRSTSPSWPGIPPPAPRSKERPASEWWGACRAKAPGSGRSLIFNGHVDVVPAGDAANWSHPPFAATVVAHPEGERVYGRGALDMKGGLFWTIAAVRALLTTGIELAGDLLAVTRVLALAAVRFCGAIA